ncbi:MAG TPA: rRNA maturation RNase YbeY [Pirellulales bacterium]
MFRIEITNEQTGLSIDEARLRAAVEAVLTGQGFLRGAVSVAIVDDPAIHVLNARYLQHDYPTDVLSFLLEEGEGFVEGEVIVSAETAAVSASRYGWTPLDELLLYVIHGTLHLTGLDDHEPEDAAEMRRQEARYLAPFGLTAAWQDRAPRLDPHVAANPKPLAKGSAS